MAKKRGRPKSPEPTTQIGFVVPVSSKTRLLELGAKEGLTLAAWVRRAVLQAMAKAA